MKILAINPGSTSTKIAVYEDETPLLVRNIRHTVEELAVFPEVTDQFEFRKSLVLTELEKEGIPFRFDAIIGKCEEVLNVVNTYALTLSEAADVYSANEKKISSSAGKLKINLK